MVHPLLSRLILLPMTSIIGKKAMDFSSFFAAVGRLVDGAFDNVLKIECLWQRVVLDILHSLKAETVGAKKQIT